MGNAVVIPKQFDNPVIKIIYERRAVRKFKDKLVDAVLLEKILDAGRMAPSAINKQPWRFYIVNDTYFIKKLSQAIIHSSKMALFKSGVKEAVHVIKNPGSFHLKNGMDFFKADDPIFHGAPLVVFITSAITNEWAHLDVGMCAQNMMLAAKSYGIDSCPIGLAKFIEHTKEYSLLNIPETHHIDLALIFGYGDEHPTLHPRIKNNAEFVLL